jgi:hypothetical protein
VEREPETIRARSGFCCNVHSVAVFGWSHWVKHEL